MANLLSKLLGWFPMCDSSRYGDCVAADQAHLPETSASKAMASIAALHEELSKRNEALPDNGANIVGALASLSGLPGGHAIVDNGDGTFSAWGHTFRSSWLAEMRNPAAEQQRDRENFQREYMGSFPDANQETNSVPRNRQPRTTSEAVEQRLEAQAAQITQPPPRSAYEEQLERAASNVLGDLGHVHRTPMHNPRYRQRPRQPVGYLVDGPAAGAPVFLNDQNQLYTDRTDVSVSREGHVRVRLIHGIYDGPHEILTPINVPNSTPTRATVLDPDTFQPRIVQRPPIPVPPRSQTPPVEDIPIAPPLPVGGERVILRRKPKPVS